MAVLEVEMVSSNNDVTGAIYRHSYHLMKLS